MSTHSAGNESLSWKRRFTELLVVQILLLASIALYVQTNNRLSLASAIVVEGFDTMPAQQQLSSPRIKSNTLADRAEEEDCIYVPGGGFSGFWFNLGMLNSIKNPHNETFVCYSGGCLGVVANLLLHGELASHTDATRYNTTTTSHYQKVYQMARSIQDDWQDGKLHRYRVVEAFIDGLLEMLEEDLDEEARAVFFEVVRTRLNILTTVFDDEEEDTTAASISPRSILPLPPNSILPRARLRQPSDFYSLKRLLLQSSWIPLATGSSWTNRGHMDGGASVAQHPKCSRTVSMKTVTTTTTTTTTDSTPAPKTPASWYEFVQKQVLLLANTLNMEIGQEDVDRLWRIGMELGV